MKDQPNPLEIPLREVIMNYLYGGEATKDQWREVAMARPDKDEFKQRVARVES
jgi:hypothetical protein